MKNKFHSLIFYLKKYKGRSIFIKDFIIAFIFVFIPVFVLGIAFYTNSKKITNEEIVNLNEANLKSYAGVIDSLLDEINVVCTNISISDEMKMYMFSDDEIVESFDIKQKVSKMIRDVTVTRKYIDSVYVYDDEDKSVFYEGGLYNLKEFKDITWYKIYEKINKVNESGIDIRLKFDNYPYVISVIRPVFSNTSSEKKGAVICNIDVEKFCKLIKIDNYTDNNFILTDKDYNVVYSSDKELKGSRIQTDNYNNIKNEVFTVWNFEKGYCLSEIESEKYNQWKYMMTYSMSKYSNKFENILYLFVLSMIISLVLSLIVALFLAYKSFRNISSIIGIIQKYDTVNNSDSFNETDYIIKNIMNTMSQNTELHNELLVQFNKMRDMQTVALQAQISPHLIRNTLSIINFKAFEIMNGENEVSDMLELFCNFIDSYISSSNYIVPLESEIENIKLYIAIMNERYGNSINCHFDINENTKDVKVIKLTLQPIVENSIIHGLNKNHFKGNIWIKSEIENDRLIVTVEDDGSGMSTDEIEELNNEFSNLDITNKVGIHNVNKRYKIAFGDNAGLVCSHSEYGGLCIRIICPDKTEEKK